jgi:hypothetical protein
MRHTRDLEAICRTGGRGTFTEGRKWKTVANWMQQVSPTGVQIPIIFGAAEDWSGLVFHAVLKAIEFDESIINKPKTIYTFSGLTPIQPHKKFSSLTLLKQRRPLSDTFIRPYALCLTPDFVMASGPERV